ncbi:hypothetical protein H2201_002008 [Coniosporium apollinis]|uniref:Hepatocellular carcinoma-associated antigen 59-domain-containing protein n=1 Tax=Coniosporium apollinis TaxID=61459 RepID=A0ABQ9P613_9PEZI|nr:hypothetical protein H2201_002008 [Coniosporium apollinis]
MANIDNETAEPLFRPSKRRKVFHKRLNDDETESAQVPPTSTPAATAAEERPLPVVSTAPDTLGQALKETLEADLSVAEILRRRKMGRARRAGIEFSNTAQTQRSASETPRSSNALVVVDQERSVLDAAAGRFAPQTGQSVDVLDKHMMAYVDSKMTALREGASALQSSRQAANSADNVRLPRGAPGQKQAASLGKLHEIDLGSDATMRNIARTEAAFRKLETGDSVEVEDTDTGRKIRQGRDGKPWRGRKRRNSEDIKRDQLVEEVLKESRLDMYDEAEVSVSNGDDQAADDLIAEQFRQEFMEQIRNNNVRRTQPKPPGAAGKGEVQARGPKLGGSRSARAAMRAQEEKAAKKK